MVTTQHLVLGTMRLQEQLAGIGNTVARFEKQMEELINKEIEVFKAMYLKKRTALSDLFRRLQLRTDGEYSGKQ